MFSLRRQDKTILCIYKFTRGSLRWTGEDRLGDYYAHSNQFFREGRRARVKKEGDIIYKMTKEETIERMVKARSEGG